MTPIRSKEVAETLEDAMQLIVSLQWVIEMNHGMSKELQTEVSAAINKLRETRDKLVLESKAKSRTVIGSRI